jgi:hypothetical protein
MELAALAQQKQWATERGIEVVTPENLKDEAIACKSS